MLFSGCFRQILPVLRGGSRAEVVQASIEGSRLHEKFRILKLFENMRLQQLRIDPSADAASLECSDFLLRLGEGRLQATDEDDVTLPPYVNTASSLQDLCDSVFEGIERN